MSDFEQLKSIKENIKHIHDPQLLFAMNQTARRLEENIKKIKTIMVTIYNN